MTPDDLPIAWPCGCIYDFDDGTLILHFCGDLDECPVLPATERAAFMKGKPVRYE